MLIRWGNDRLSNRDDSIIFHRPKMSLLLHDGILRERSDLYNRLRLCVGSPEDDRSSGNNDDSWKLCSAWNLTTSCQPEEQFRLGGTKELLQLDSNNTLWKHCAESKNFTKLFIRRIRDSFAMACPTYRFATPRNNNDPHDVLLANNLRYFKENIFHMMVMDDPNHQPGRGRELWCMLDAVTRFAERFRNTTNLRWLVEYRNETVSSRYFRALLALLGSHQEDEDGFHPTISMRPRLGVKRLQHDVFVKSGHVSHSFDFRPLTRPIPVLIKTADRVVRLVASAKQLSSDHRDNVRGRQPYVLLLLRSGKSRRMVGSETGTATEIVHAMLKESLPVKIMDSACVCPRGRPSSMVCFGPRRRGHARRRPNQSCLDESKGFHSD